MNANAPTKVRTTIAAVRAFNDLSGIGLVQSKRNVDALVKAFNEDQDLTWCLTLPLEGRDRATGGVKLVLMADLIALVRANVKPVTEVL